MKKVPYYSNPNNDWCALACYTMVGQYLLPKAEITFEKFKKLADARKGYVVWAYPVWSWLLDHGVSITDTDISDHQAWLDEGLEGFKRSVTPTEFEFYDKNTYDLNQVTKDMKKTMLHPNFKYKQAKVTWDMIVDVIKQPGICDMTVQGRILNGKEGFSVHRVVLIDITNKDVIVHDPNVAGNGKYRHIPIPIFQAAFNGLSGAELCHYYLGK